jgi:hypothetical protein
MNPLKYLLDIQCNLAQKLSTILDALNNLWNKMSDDRINE